VLDRLRRDVEHLRRRHRHDDELGRRVDLREAARGAHRVLHAARAVDRRHHAAEAAVDEVGQHRPAEPARRARGEHDRHGGRGEDRPQRRDGAAVVARLDARPHRLAGMEVEGDRHLAERHRPPHVEAGRPEHAQHRPVVGHHLGVEAEDRALRRDVRELLQHPRRGAAAVEVVRDREGDLRRTGLAQAVVPGGGDDPVAVAADQRDAVGPVGLGVLARRRIRAAEAVEAHVPALLGEGVVERLDRLEVVRHGRAQPERRPVAQEHVADQRRRGHRLTAPSGGRCARPPVP
jgi:hypothetical protein